MSGIKGIVLLTRLNFVEHHYGKDGLKTFFDKMDVDKESPLFQPIMISKDYSEDILSNMDKVLLNEFFEGNLKRFYELGVWNTKHLMPTYFQIYIDEKNPGGFIEQMARLRPYLIGLGEMSVSAIESNEYFVLINYGQEFPESARLSELGFLEEGLRLCGAKEVKSKIEEKDETSVEYKIKWK
ncbi:MAG: hypothetical protein GXO77_15280 [Calditrichaeota bacterium]|nr:hypothetical protein [Calditrichota bacterium]